MGPRDFTPAQAEAEHEHPGRDEVVVPSGAVGEESLGLGDRPRPDPPPSRLGDLDQGGHVLADLLFGHGVRERSTESVPGSLDDASGRGPAALADGTAAPLFKATLGVLALGAALAGGGELVDPLAHVPDGDFVDPLRAEVRVDVVPH